MDSLPLAGLLGAGGALLGGGATCLILPRASVMAGTLAGGAVGPAVILGAALLNLTTCLNKDSQDESTYVKIAAVVLTLFFATIGSVVLPALLGYSMTATTLAVADFPIIASIIGSVIAEELKS